MFTSSSSTENESLTIEDRGVFLFTGEVNEESYDDAVRWIIEQNFEAKHSLLTMIINSQGGSVTDGFGIIDAMAGSKIPIRTVGIGTIASMGLLIFIAGKEGERILTPNTLILSHQWTNDLFGKQHELLAGIKHNKLIGDMVMRHYKKHTGLTEKQIRKDLLPPSDVYLTAAEAKELGICDEVRVLN